MNDHVDDECWKDNRLSRIDGNRYAARQRTARVSLAQKKSDESDEESARKHNLDGPRERDRKRRQALANQEAEFIPGERIQLDDRIVNRG